MTPNKFRRLIYAHYTKRGRHTLPWRKTTNPYHILVSEVMLQQTQVARVIPYYGVFLKRFPTLRALALAPLGDVLRVWQGLGYNRRAKMFHECARAVMKQYRGRLPRTYEALMSLPGIGPYTAGAVMAFAFNKPVVMIETNIRTVFIHHFFPRRGKVHDRELVSLIEKMLDKKNPRTWYAALMDYGAYLKRTEGNIARRSAHHVKQSRFDGSDRQIRGALLRALMLKAYTQRGLSNQLAYSSERVHAQLSQLCQEGLVVQKKGVYTLPDD